MRKHKTKNADAAALAEGYGVSLERAKQALAADAPRPSVPAQEKPADPAEAQPTPTVDAADRGPQKTSSELAMVFFLGRERMESELIRLGLRGPADDGQTRYPLAEVSRRLAAEDATRFGGIVELVTNFTSNPQLAAKIVEEAIDEEMARWIAENSLHGKIADLKTTLLIRFQKSHRYQAARRSGDALQELAAIQEFGTALLAAVSAEGDTSHAG
jgi:hypothetical protein